MKSKTERTTRPAKRAVSTEIPKTDPADPSSEIRKMASPLDPNMASRTHGLIIDAVSELLTHGGHPADVDALLYAAMRHTRRRTFTFGHGFDDRDQIDTRAEDFLRANFEEWKTDLAIGWRKNKRPETAVLEPKTITEQIRVTFRERCLSGFKSFMRDASPEEIAFMAEVFLWRENRNLPAETGRNEIYIGLAFECELQSAAHAYLKVSESMVPKVQKYIDALKELEGREA